MFPSGAGVVLDNMALVSALDRALAMEEAAPKSLPLAEAAPPPAPPAIGWSLDWRQIGVSFGAGVVVALLFSWQVRELRRRR